jgi:hypothetical protein
MKGVRDSQDSNTSSLEMVGSEAQILRVRDLEFPLDTTRVFPSSGLLTPLMKSTIAWVDEMDDIMIDSLNVMVENLPMENPKGYTNRSNPHASYKKTLQIKHLEVIHTIVHKRM